MRDTSMKWMQSDPVSASMATAARHAVGLDSDRWTRRDRMVKKVRGEVRILNVTALLWSDAGVALSSPLEIFN